MQGKLKSPLKWYGGKTPLLSKLLPLIPEHQTYVEVFAGSAALFFAKDIAPVEVINDLDSGIVNFFRVLRDENKWQELVRLISLTPYSREEFFRYRDTWEETSDEVHKAHRWFITMRMSYSAAGKSFSCSIKETRKGMAHPVSAYLSAVDRLPEIHERLKTVQIDHDDFRKVIQRYDTPNTFFYLDPPYVHSTRKSTKYYAHEMLDDDHGDLVQMLLAMKGKAMLSGYVNPLYEPLESAGWERLDFPVKFNVTPLISEAGHTGQAAAKKKEARTESVWIKC